MNKHNKLYSNILLIYVILPFFALLYGCEQHKIDSQNDQDKLILSFDPIVLPDTNYSDRDLDSVTNNLDNCPDTFNPHQFDFDHDGIGDTCDPCPSGNDTLDSDNDSFDDCHDFCPHTPSTNNLDSDNDGVGDACDNCPHTPNGGQQLLSPSSFPSCSKPNFSIDELTITDIHNALFSGNITCEELINQYLQRIVDYDLATRNNKPPINAFVALNPAALTTARALDRSFKEDRRLVGALHCVPIVVKDLYAVKDMPVSFGSQAFRSVELVAAKSANIVERLSNQGAIILGTTTMDELASGVYGIGSRHGRTGNPYDSAQNPGGSSSGSAAAVAANFAVSGLGTDNCGSITLPAAFNGLVGLRPTLGTISRDGVYVADYGNGTPGAMARNTEDLAAILDSVWEPKIPLNIDITFPSTTFSAQLKDNNLKGKRIGILRAFSSQEYNYKPYSNKKPRIQKLYQNTISRLNSSGAEIVDNIIFNNIDLDRHGFGNYINFISFSEYLKPFVGNILENACNYGKASQYIYISNKDKCLNILKSSRAYDEKVQLGYDIYRKFFSRGLAIDNFLKEHHLDALLYPAADSGTPSYFDLGYSCALAASSATPQLAFNIGFVDGLPVGMILQGSLGSDKMLLGIVHSFEQTLHPRRPPTLSHPSSTTNTIDITSENALRNQIGLATYEKVLKHANSAFDLTPNKFLPIVKDILLKNGKEHLTK